MCGVAGLLRLGAGTGPVSGELLTAMRDTMTHRGPDGCGLWLDVRGDVGLGHRRLSIIDPAPEAGQPMGTRDRSSQLSFNGEIYNHAELRAQLAAEGVADWRTDHSDTEVLLRALTHWGVEPALHRLRGMFAFAYWDGTRRELWLVRDRLGVKPLYWAAHEGTLAFASEIKALLANSRLPRKIDEESLFHYLSFLTTPAPRTLFDGISKLPAGGWLRARPGGDITTGSWWDVLDHAAPLDLDAGPAAERVLEALRTSVRYRNVSDVPIGVFLSGGVDSSANAALFTQTSTMPLRTFSIGYEQDGPSYRNELEWARRMADKVGAEHHERLLTLDDLVAFLPRLAAIQDEPLADPVCFPVHEVAALARQHGVVVAQVGEGADELFCGYPFWLRSLQLQRMADLPGGRALAGLGAAAFAAAGRHDFRVEWMQRAGRGQPVFWSGAEAFTHAQKVELLSPDLRTRLDGLSSWDALAPLHRRFHQTAWEPSALNWMTYSDLRLRLPELLLMRVDKMTMDVSLEARVPFLDHELVTLAMSLPSSIKLAGGGTKPLLKRAVRGLVPDELIDRPKQGFGVPVQEYLLDRMGDQARREITAFCVDSGLINAPRAMAYIERADAQRTWVLFNLALWWRRWIA